MTKTKGVRIQQDENKYYEYSLKLSGKVIQALVKKIRNETYNEVLAEMALNYKSGRSADTLDE